MTSLTLETAENLPRAGQPVTASSEESNRDRRGLAGNKSSSRAFLATFHDASWSCVPQSDDEPSAGSEAGSAHPSCCALPAAEAVTGIAPRHEAEHIVAYSNDAATRTAHA